MIMEKRTYIQPEMEVEALNSDNALMQLILGSPTAKEPGKLAPKRISPTNPVAAADTVQVF